jgi:transposase
LDRGTTEDKKPSGRPCIYDKREKRDFIREAMRSPLASLKTLTDNRALNSKNVCKTTVYNMLKEAQIFSMVLSRRFDQLSKKNINDRKIFCKEHKNWAKEDWEWILFSDESDLFPIKCGKRYLRVRNEKKILDPKSLTKNIQRNITVKVWGIIGYNGPGPLIRYHGPLTQDDYIEILQEGLLKAYPSIKAPSMASNSNHHRLMFADDNASSHRAHSVLEWKDKNQINSLRLPARSPDINVIENVWAYLQDKLYEIADKLEDSEDVWNNALRIWHSINNEYIEKLYSSLPGRIERIAKRNGAPI